MAESFDTLIDAYEQLGKHIPLFQKYQALFPESPEMKEALKLIYRDILEFHRKALRFFYGPGKQKTRSATGGSSDPI